MNVVVIFEFFEKFFELSTLFFVNLFEVVRNANKFRTLDSIQRIIFSLFVLAKKKHKLRILRIRSRITKLENIYISLEHPIKMDRTIHRHRKKLKLFCINDNEKTKQENRKLLKSYLEFLFPEKQSWEL